MRNLRKKISLLVVAILGNIAILWIAGILDLYVVYQLSEYGWKSRQFWEPLAVSMALTAFWYAIDKWILINRTKK